MKILSALAMPLTDEKKEEGGCHGMLPCLQVIALFVMALFCEMSDIRLYLSEWIFIAMVLCYVFVCGSSYFALTLTDESNIGHVMRMLQSSVLLTFLRRIRQVTQYKEINSNQKPAAVLYWHDKYSFPQEIK